VIVTVTIILLEKEEKGKESCPGCGCSVRRVGDRQVQAGRKKQDPSSARTAREQVEMGGSAAGYDTRREKGCVCVCAGGRQVDGEEE
jgi:hypothetical protein